MKEQIYYEDLVIGHHIPTLIKQPTTRQLVMWAGVSGDYNQIHYDKDFAQSMGLPGVIVQGQLVFSFLVQLITDWIGELGSLRRLSCNYQGMNLPGEALSCQGKIMRKYIEGDHHYVECNIWVENPRKEITLSGTAVAIIPTRS